MSRIGKQPIVVPQGVKVELRTDNFVSVTGPKGSLQRQLTPEMSITLENGSITVARPSDSQTHRALHGLTRTLLANMVIGVTTGFKRDLEITGTGYRVVKSGESLIFLVGYSHPVQIDPPEGVAFLVEGINKCSVLGYDKEKVGQTAALIRSIRKPEPYKGKGIKYTEEVIRRKAGKAAKAGGKKK